MIMRGDVTIFSKFLINCITHLRKLQNRELHALLFHKKASMYKIGIKIHMQGSS